MNGWWIFGLVLLAVAIDLIVLPPISKYFHQSRVKVRRQTKYSELSNRQSPALTSFFPWINRWIKNAARKIPGWFRSQSIQFIGWVNDIFARMKRFFSFLKLPWHQAVPGKVKLSVSAPASDLTSGFMPVDKPIKPFAEEHQLRESGDLDVTLDAFEENIRQDSVNAPVEQVDTPGKPQNGSHVEISVTLAAGQKVKITIESQKTPIFTQTHIK